MVVKFDDATTLEENDNGALQTHFENSVAFVMDHWKPLLIGGISVFVLLVSVFLITFFAVRGNYHCEKGSKFCFGDQ